MRCVYYEYVKRWFDIIVSVCLLIVTIPLFLILIFTNWIFLGRPIFFRQQRYGKDGRMFWLIKLRSMPEKHQNRERDLPLYGRIIRSLSLDELPNLWNILWGDLSLVGPRPLLTTFYAPAWRHRVRPGLTGLAQIHGRNAISWRKKFRYDLHYVRHYSFSMDCWIIWRTALLHLFKPHGTALAPPEHYAPSQCDDCCLDTD